MPEEKAGRLLYQVKLGTPKNKQLQKMMEEPAIRQLVDEAELQSHEKARARRTCDLKEELFFTIDEKQHDSDLAEKGRVFLSPG